MIDILHTKRDEIADICRCHSIVRLEVFGSAASGTFNEETSDFDFIVDLGDYEPGMADRFLTLADDLEQALGRYVDLVTNQQIRKPYFKCAVNRHREVVYERASRQEVA